MRSRAARSRCAATNTRWRSGSSARAFSSEVDAGSREENASKQKARASVLIQSEPQCSSTRLHRML
ncbi:hypothetical protein XH93_27550 [Bradyrhizobium sp. CCBAU 51753]|nr:hypothetical protein XH93_27550 [Bradyrhizobium sp. CCBAU 51753]